MQTARYYGPADAFTLEERPIPVPRTGEVLLRVLAAGICHTELHLLNGELNPGVTPLTPGHEIAGEVAAVGPGVEGWEPGARAVVYYYVSCGECTWCRRGEEQLCPNVGRQIGFTADGGYAQYVVVPARTLVPIPAELHPALACTLGCSAATAYHAIHSVGELRPGETAVVYGAGAVGFALIQLARDAGARVLAVGRNPAKREVAKRLGATEAFAVMDGDPVAAVLRATGGQGADIVFDLVAGRDTMENGLRMLGRRGRLVLVGYGDEPLVVTPLMLVLRETQIRAAVGNTRAELERVIALATTGSYRALVSRVAPLGGLPDLIAALRDARILGRAVLAPNGPLPPLPPSVDELLNGDEPTPPLAAHQQESSKPPLEAELLRLVTGGVDQPRDEADFNQLALRLFAYQFAHNEPFHRFCAARGVTPGDLSDWRQVPAVPIAAFKETVLACDDVAAAEALFMSSGTTRPERRSRHYHPALRIYDAGAAANWQAHLLPDLSPGRRLPLLILNPPPETLPHSSLAHYLDLMRRRFGDERSGFYVDEGGLRLDALLQALVAAEGSGEPVALLGTTFAFVHLLDACAEGGRRFRLPAGSRVMDTGGVKGQSREVGRNELLTGLHETFGIERSHIVNMYGLTELSTQFLDATLRNTMAGRALPRYKTVVPWARTRVLDPETLAELPPGEIGLLCHFDLANWSSVSHILTEDLGHELGDGFEIVGRAAGAETRGCSLAIDELLRAVR